MVSSPARLTTGQSQGASFQGGHCGICSAGNESTAVYVDGRHENRKVHLVTNVTLICIIEALCADGGLKDRTLVLWFGK